MIIPESLRATYKARHEAVGPLRYQMAVADCVPTTIVNGLLFVTRKQVPQRLMRLIWACSLDQPSGTGWVCSKILAETLHAWFTMSEFDGEKHTLSEFQSKAKQGNEVLLKQNNALVTALNSGGAACITTEGGGHYALLHSHDKGREFYGFDPTWLGPRKRKKAIELSNESFGMVNIRWTRQELLAILSNDANQFIHLIYPTNSE